MLHSNDSINSVKDATSKEMQFYETESLPALENSSDITEAFTKLLETDKNLHNKILQYEPVNIEALHSTLRARGFKCKLSNLMSFLDEQVYFCFCKNFFSLNFCAIYSNKYMHFGIFISVYYILCARSECQE